MPILDSLDELLDWELSVVCRWEGRSACVFLADSSEEADPFARVDDTHEFGVGFQDLIRLQKYVRFRLL